MINEYLNSEKAQKMITELSEKMDGLLIAGRTYHSISYRDKYGSSGSGISFHENGKRYDYSHSGNYKEDEIKKHIDGLRECRYSDLITFFPVYSKIKFTFKKGERINAERYSIPMLLDDIKNETEHTASIHCGDDSTFIKAETLIHFKKEAGETALFIDATYHYNDKVKSFGHAITKDILPIYHQLGGTLRSLYFLCENGTIKVQSDPACEDVGFEPLMISHIELSPEYKKEKEIAAKAKKLRHDFFSSLGKLDERIIYLRIGGFRNHPWPENSTSHNSCKMRVIHAPESTILITDGLSDIYKDFYHGKNSQYNGIGAEFYMEFYGNIPYEVIHEHFAVALVNSVSQIAIAHGDFKVLIENHREISLEFTEENIELWINKENNANQDLSTFLVQDNFFMHGSFAVLLGMESQTVPQKLQMNLEEILLVSIKPVGKEWLSNTRLRSDDDEVAKEARQNIMREWKEKGEWNLLPLTYQKEYIKKDIESNIVQVPVFPF